MSEMPDELKKIRDDFADDIHTTIRGSWGPDVKEGFDKCFEEMSKTHVPRKDVQKLIEVLHRAQHGFDLIRMLSDRHDTKDGCNANMPNIYKNALVSGEDIKEAIKEFK